MSRSRALGLPVAIALAVTALAATPSLPSATAAEPVDSLTLLQPHALDQRVAEDGTPIALRVGDRIVGARPSETPAVVDLATAATGTRYFVDCQAADGGSGTAVDSPLNSLADASELELGPGDQLLLKAGTECVGQLLLTGSGAQGQRILVDAYGDAADGLPLLAGDGVESVVRINQGEHWEVRNLEITNRTDDSRDYTTPRRGIVVALTDYGRGTDYVISDNYIHHVWGQNRKDLGGSGGIQFEAYAGPAKTPTAFDDVVIRHNVVENVNRSGINVGSDFRTRPSVGGSIQDNPFYAWGPLHIHDNLVSNIGGDGIVNQFAEGSLIENNTVWDTSNHHGGKANNGNNAAVWSWDSDYVTFRSNHVFNTKMPAGTWDGTAFDADYGTAGTVFEYNVTHDNEGGFMLFCGCGGLSTDTVMRYNVSLNDGKGGENHDEGPRLFFNAGQSDGEVYNNTFLLYPDVQLNKGASAGTAVLFANNVLLAQGDVQGSTAKAEPWRNNVFAGTWNSWPQQGNRNQLVPGLGLAEGAGLARLQVATESVIANGVPVQNAGNEGLGYWDEPNRVDVQGDPVPTNLRPDVGAFQHTAFAEAADVAVIDGGFEDAEQAAWVLEGAEFSSAARNGTGAATLDEGAVSQTVTLAANRTYRLTAAVKGDVEVSLTRTSPQGESVQEIRALATQQGEVADGWTAVSTVIRTASDAAEGLLEASGTGLVDDIALTEVADYVVDGSFESPSNSPWGGTRSMAKVVAGQYAADLGARASYENNEVVVPGAGSYELWGWGVVPVDAKLALGVKNTGNEQVTATITAQQWSQASAAFSTAKNRFTAFCYSGGAAVAGMHCDDVSVTPAWDMRAPAVAATPVHVVPEAPADPPAPPRPQSEYLAFDQVEVVGASSENSDGPASNVNNSATGSIWHTRWSPSMAQPPHWITLLGPVGHELTALAYTPRQDNSWNGVANDWKVLGSADAAFSDPVVLAEGTWSKSRSTKVAEFVNPTALRYVRLEVVSHHGDAPADAFATAAILQLRGYEVAPVMGVRPDGGAAEATAGAGITVEVSGMRPGTPAAVTLANEGTTIALGTLEVGKNGRGNETFTIPADTPGGDWQVTATQTAVDGLDDVVAESAIKVLPASTPTPDPTATTSPDPTPTTSPDPTVTPTASSSPSATGTPTVTPSPSGDLYSTPGFHYVNGRHWYTRCEPYSQTQRCFTDIWATEVAQVDGRWVQRNGWVFNNLTYLPSARSLWVGNPLGNAGSWVDANGKRWRTECDTAGTGRNGCRSWIYGPVATAVKDSSGATNFELVGQWRFNNIVRFG